MLKRTGDRKDIGNKAFDLYRCKLLGISVPEFYVVPIDGFESSMRTSIKDELKEALDRLGGVVAVRSSSVSEDRSTGSAAGRYKTVLRVKDVDGLTDAISEVLASADGTDMAVLVQEQLEPDISGVLFTRNPVNSQREFVIEHVEGLGDKLVSGKVDPERLVIKKEGSFHNERFDKLINIAVTIEDHFGYPLDIEWASASGVFYILQARPITNLLPPERNAGKTYSRVQAEQFYSGPVSPLFYSFFNLLHSKYYLQETLDAIGWDLMMNESLIRHKGHLYIDTALSEFVLTNFPIKGGREFLADVFPDDLKSDLMASKARLNLSAGLGLLKYIIGHRRLWAWNLERSFRNEVVPVLYKMLDELDDLHQMSLEELKDTYHRIMDCAVLHIRYSKWGLALYLPLFLGGVERSLQQAGLNKNRLSDLMSGLPENKTLEASIELGKLAKLVSDEPRAASILATDHNGYQNYRKELLKVRSGKLIVEYFESILKRYGHRRLSRDLLSPSWKDEPEIPFSILQKMVHDGAHDTSDLKRVASKRRHKLEKQIVSRLPLSKRSRFKILSKYFVRYVTFRELQRFYIDMIISSTRELVIEVGKRMVADRLLKRSHDIFFIDLDDILRYLSGIRDRGLMKKAAFHRVTFENETDTPGRFLRGGIDFDSSASPVKNIQNTRGRIVTGEGISPGFFTGKVRVIPDIDSNITVEKNDIIVTKCIDPGQTHVFLLAGALIFEVGGMLSHGAILAREFNLPTVANIRNATGLFKDGQRISVDGTKGEIVIK